MAGGAVTVRMAVSVLAVGEAKLTTAWLGASTGGE